MFNQIDIVTIVICSGILLCGYIISIYLNIVIVKGEYGFLPGTYKLYSLAVIVSVLCNFIDVICIKNKITDDFFLVKLFLIGGALLWVYSKKKSGNPRWVADFKDIYSGELDPNMPFSSTEGMAICIFVAYTLPTKVAIIVTVLITLIQGLHEIGKYRLIRTVVLAIIAGGETAIASWLVRLSYGCDTLKAIFFIALIGMVFNILLGTFNGKILDSITGDTFLK